MTSKAGYKRFYPWLKWIFSALSLYFFYQQIVGLESNVIGNIGAGIQRKPLLFSLIILLAFVNWNAEAQKFKLLIREAISLTNLRAFLTILGGMAISNFTPARTGEYIGRGLLLKKVHPMKVVIATVAGNIAQVLMTYSLGLLSIGGVLLFSDMGGDWFSGDGKLIAILVLLFVIVLLLYFIQDILRIVKRYLPKKVAKTLNMVKRYDRALYLKVVQIAFLRYLAFGVQFYLLLQLFSDFALPVEALILVPSAYLMQSLVPVPAISDVGVRVVVSQLLFGSFLLDAPILQAVTSLWFINLILPGLFGTVYLLISTIRQR
ncbi:MAG: lysylphosphatidylglycerol synthase domain-containing protein [Bacteroidia bacterium]